MEKYSKNDNFFYIFIIILLNKLLIILKIIFEIINNATSGSIKKYTASVYNIMISDLVSGQSDGEKGFSQNAMSITFGNMKFLSCGRERSYSFIRALI